MALPRVTLPDARLVTDPETRTTTDGKAATRLRLVAADRRKNPETGNWEDAATCWITATCYGETAKHAAASLAKGDLVVLTGRLVTREWTTEGGENRSSIVVLVDEIGPSLRFRTMPHGVGHGAQESAQGEQSIPGAPNTAGGGNVDPGGYPAF